MTVKEILRSIQKRPFITVITYKVEKKENDKSEMIIGEEDKWDDCRLGPAISKMNDKHSYNYFMSWEQLYMGSII